MKYFINYSDFLLIVLLLSVNVYVSYSVRESYRSQLGRSLLQNNVLSPKDIFKRNLNHITCLPIIFGSQLIFSQGTKAESEPNIYVDNLIGFSVAIPPGWVSLPRNAPATTLSKYQQEQVLFTANNFAEGASLSVTKTDSRRLLKDFNIEWWFAPLEKIQDLGSPELLAELLILQRQGNFEKRDTPSELLNAKFDDKEQACLFEFTTPLAEEVYRKTIAKAYYRQDSLAVFWISALSSVFEGDYSEQLTKLRNSFLLTKKSIKI
jgi:hypothetical protein